MVAQVTGAYADIYTWENLYTAYRKAAKGKRGRHAAAAFAFRLEDNLIQLQESTTYANTNPVGNASPKTHACSSALR